MPFRCARPNSSESGCSGLNVIDSVCRICTTGVVGGDLPGEAGRLAKGDKGIAQLNHEDVVLVGVAGPASELVEDDEIECDDPGRWSLSSTILNADGNMFGREFAGTSRLGLGVLG